MGDICDNTLKVKRILRVRNGGRNLRMMMILGGKAEKKKGDSVRENSPIEAEIKYLKILIFNLSSTFI